MFPSKLKLTADTSSRENRLALERRAARPPGVFAIKTSFNWRHGATSPQISNPGVASLGKSLALCTARSIPPAARTRSISAVKSPLQALLLDRWVGVSGLPSSPRVLIISVPTLKIPAYARRKAAATSSLFARQFAAPSPQNDFPRNLGAHGAAKVPTSATSLHPWRQAELPPPGQSCFSHSRTMRQKSATCSAMILLAGGDLLAAQRKRLLRDRLQ